MKKIMNIYTDFGLAEIETYYGTVTESEARAIVRDIELNKGEGDERVYSYEPSPKFTGLFCIVVYPLEKTNPLPLKW